MFSVSAEAPSSQETRKRVSRRQGVAATGRAINCLTSRNQDNPALNAEHRPATDPPPLTQRGLQAQQPTTAKAANRNQPITAGQRTVPNGTVLFFARLYPPPPLKTSPTRPVGLVKLLVTNFQVRCVSSKISFMKGEIRRMPVAA